MDFSFHPTPPLSSLPLVQARLSFFPRYYLVSTPLCHGSTKFEAFIECLRTEDRPQPPPRLQASSSLSLSLPLIPFRFPSLTLSPPLRLSLCPFFSAAVLLPRPVYISNESVGKRRNATRTEFSVCFSLGYSGLRSRPRFSVQRYTSVRRARLCTRCSRYFAVIRGERGRERERGRETTGSNCQPGYAVRILVKFFIRRVSLAHLLARRLISGRER